MGSPMLQEEKPQNKTHVSEPNREGMPTKGHKGLYLLPSSMSPDMGYFAKRWN